MGEIQDQLYGKVTGDMDVFKKIASKVPGFSGYIERQSRRDSDKLLRQMLADRFRELEKKVSSLQRDFIASGDLKYVDDLEASALKLRTFSDRVRTASRGYSGLFDAVKINEEELALLYGYDASMLDQAEEIDHAIDNVAASVGTDGLPAALRDLNTRTEDCIEIFNRRDEVVFAK
ncbi:MAG TPA: hypothetical protein VJ768_05220 [Anaerolineales bacterium]|jgi:hypothetical protein|nr:hypothetical protein [Anaerolineales bacterium]